MIGTALEFYFDFISPYAYLAWTQIHALAARHGFSVEPRPILFAALLNAHGHKGPAEIPPKRAYIFKNVLRIAHRLHVHLAPPPAHPFNPLLALRVSSLPMSADERRRLIDALFAATWGGGNGISDSAEVGEAATRAGLDGAALVAQAAHPIAKERLRVQTEHALSLGIFGVPTIVAGGEIFWGYDAFPDLEEHLAGKDPIDAQLVQRWLQLPAQATRI